MRLLEGKVAVVTGGNSGIGLALLFVLAELVGMNFFRGRVVCGEASALCPMHLQNKSRSVIELSAALEEQTQSFLALVMKSIKASEARAYT